MFDLEVMKWGGNKYWSRRVSKGSMWSLVSTLSRVVYWHQLYTLRIKNNLYWKEKLQVVFRFPAWTKNRQNPLKEWNRSPSTFHRLTRKPWHIGPMLRLTLIGSTFSQNASLNNWEKKPNCTSLIFYCSHYLYKWSPYCVKMSISPSE